MASQIPMEQFRSPAGKGWPYLPACEQLSSHVSADSNQIITSVYGLEMYSETGDRIPDNYSSTLESYGLCKTDGVHIAADQLFSRDAPDREVMGTADETTKPIERPRLPESFLTEQTTKATLESTNHGFIFYGSLTLAIISTLVTLILIGRKFHVFDKIQNIIED
ncbi:hypothetical protein IQ265_06535 [Nodosilinea sp. LEGE 06152]|uniref:hypothetical protein n=1 Tax=Nodosilinea sp. LEGE 06152 TaxID=2777966 RepID=UPI0018805423|nr:hypothetical protein [Nodosilinea sp. LEGE 06152]MBE9156486.1 hypothetical protein [Nodosilinea sp. LEGE 06152]